MMAQREQRLVPERVIGGKYKIIRLLGEGGMGGVYEAENELTHKRVAIKWLHPSLAGSRDAVQRLLREAQACARVRHPHVVDVYDVGQEDDAIFLVMEYLEGETFRALLARGELELPALIGLLIPAMRGVAAVHAQGIIHRDIKPDNIFLARVPDYPNPIPKVLDFGISKVDARQGEMDTLTQSGVTMGTPLYMSFEQLSGAKDADARSDIYAFGVMLYEAATGRPPFEADSFAALAVKVATTQPVSPHSFNPELDRRLEAIILKAIARDRNQRFSTLDELIAELEPFAWVPESRGSTPTRLRAQPTVSSSPAAFAQTISESKRDLAAASAAPARSRGLAVLILVLIVGVAAFTYLRSAPVAPLASPPTPALALPSDEPPDDKTEIPRVAPAAPPPIEGATLPLPAPPPADDAPSVAKPTQSTHGRRRHTPDIASETAVSAPVAPDPAPSTAPKPEPVNGDKGFRAGQPRLDEF